MQYKFTCPIPPPVFPKLPGPSQYTHLSLLDNSIGYEKTLHKKHLNIIELQLYNNNITGCIYIVVILYARIQYHLFKTSIKCSTLFYNLTNYKLQSIFYFTITS